jgi:hypothetical protein
MIIRRRRRRANLFVGIHRRRRRWEGSVNGDFDVGERLMMMIVMMGSSGGNIGQL